MALFAKNLRADTDEDATEVLPAEREPYAGQIVYPDDDEIAPTRQDQAYGYAQTYPSAQSGGYLGQVLTQDHISQLMGPQQLPTPRALIRVDRFFGHVAQSPLSPAVGIIAMAGLSAWAHDEPHHALWGGVIIALGALVARSGIHAHKLHGADADPLLTRGAVAVGGGAGFVGVGVAAGMSHWLALATGAAGLAAYGGRLIWRHHRLEATRRFAVGIVAAGNTGPALPGTPAALPWGGLVSDEEYRLRKAFTAIGADKVMIGSVQRIPNGPWYVIVNLSDTDLTASQVERQAEKIASVMEVRLVEVEQRDLPCVAKITVHDGDDPLADTIPPSGATVASALDPIPLGPHEDGSTASITLAWKHTLVCGTTDMGKSGVLNLILCKTMPAQNLARILIDCKQGAPEFRAYKDVAFHVANTLEGAMRTLAGIEGIYRYRGDLLVEKDVVPERDDETGETVQKWREEFGPFILCSIDELTELTDKVPGAAKRIQSLRRVMRFVGLFALDATQFPDRNTFGGTATARMNYLNRISLAIAEQGGTNIIFGQGAHGRGWRPDMLDLPGKFLMATPTVKRPRKARAERFEPTDVARAVADWRGRVPELDEGSAEAFWAAYQAYQDEEEQDGGGGPRGGKRREVQDAPPVGTAYTRNGTTMYVVPTYPGGEEIDERYVRLWQLLGEYGRAGASVRQLAARAEALEHKYTSRPWVQQRLDYWVERGFVDLRTEGREAVFWRKDLRSEEARGGAAS